MYAYAFGITQSQKGTSKKKYSTNMALYNRTRAFRTNGLGSDMLLYLIYLLNKLVQLQVHLHIQFAKFR